MNPKTPQWKLRRLASRVLRVHERQRDKEPALASFDHTLGISGPAFIAAYDAVHNGTASRMSERKEGKQHIDRLIRKLRAWAPLVAADVDHISTGDFGENPNVPDDVIKDAESLLEHARKHVAEDGTPLPYLDTLEEDLGAVLAEAKTQWQEAEGAQTGYEEALELARETGATFEQHLIAYRRSLRAVIGTKSSEYQKLRRERARAADADDDEIAAALPPGTDDNDDDDEPTDGPANEDTQTEALSA